MNYFGILAEVVVDIVTTLSSRISALNWLNGAPSLHLPLDALILRNAILAVRK